MEPSTEAGIAGRMDAADCEPNKLTVGRDVMERLSALTNQAQRIAVDASDLRRALVGSELPAAEKDNTPTPPEPDGLVQFLHNQMDLLEACLMQTQQELHRIAQF